MKAASLCAKELLTQTQLESKESRGKFSCHMMLFQWFVHQGRNNMWTHTHSCNLGGSFGMQKVKFKGTEYSKCPKGQYENWDYMSLSYQRKKNTDEDDHVLFWWFVLTLQSRCSRLWSEAHFLWSSESSSTWLSRLKCSRASFSCISRTCSSCSKEHTLPRYQMGLTRQVKLL